jgi:hypothetical protein
MLSLSSTTFWIRDSEPGFLYFPALYNQPHFIFLVPAINCETASRSLNRSWIPPRVPLRRLTPTSPSAVPSHSYKRALGSYRQSFSRIEFDTLRSHMYRR